MKKTLETIYVKLVGEQVDVSRPVQAEHLRDEIYRIANKPYDRDSETWEFGLVHRLSASWSSLPTGQFLGAPSLVAAEESSRGFGERSLPHRASLPLKRYASTSSRSIPTIPPKTAERSESSA